MVWFSLLPPNKLKWQWHQSPSFEAARDSEELLKFISAAIFYNALHDCSKTDYTYKLN